jgi:hypothetical protein
VGLPVAIASNAKWVAVYPRRKSRYHLCEYLSRAE